jgi:hypothetical protein
LSFSGEEVKGLSVAFYAGVFDDSRIVACTHPFSRL